MSTISAPRKCVRPASELFSLMLGLHGQQWCCQWSELMIKLVPFMVDTPPHPTPPHTELSARSTSFPSGVPWQGWQEGSGPSGGSLVWAVEWSSLQLDDVCAPGPESPGAKLSSLPVWPSYLLHYNKKCWAQAGIEGMGQPSLFDFFLLSEIKLNWYLWNISGSQSGRKSFLKIPSHLHKTRVEGLCQSSMGLTS